MRIIGIIVTGLFGVLMLFGVTWAVEGNSFFLYQYFAPKEEAVRRETFEQSRAYRQGMTQELENMQMQYVSAKPEDRPALASIILHRASGVDENIMSSDLRYFIHTLKEGR